MSISSGSEPELFLINSAGSGSTSTGQGGYTRKRRWGWRGRLFEEGDYFKCFRLRGLGGEGAGRLFERRLSFEEIGDSSIGEALFTCSSNKDAVNCDMYLSEAGLFCFLNSFFDHVGVQSVVKDRCKELTEQ